MRLVSGWKLLCKHLKNESGYSLVEVLASIMILSIAVIPMVSMFDAGLRAAVLGANYDKGRALANEKLEEIKAQSYSDVAADFPPVNGSPAGSSDPCPPSPPDYKPFGCTVETTYVKLGTTEITSDPNVRTMMRVNVTVTWGSSNSYTTTGLVSK